MLNLKTGGRGILLGVALGAGLLGAGPASASIIYTVDQTIGVGSVIGTITTDGQTGTLGIANFLSWNLTLNGDGASFTIASSDADAFINVVGSDVFATPTEITFNFSAADNGYLLFQDGKFSGMHYWCNAASA